MVTTAGWGDVTAGGANRDVVAALGSARMGPHARATATLLTCGQ